MKAFRLRLSDPGSASPDPTDPLQMGDAHIIALLNAEQAVPRFLLRGSLGRGAQARTVALWDQQLQREIACKIQRTASARNDWLRERRILSGLNHPNILPLLDADEADELCWLSMPLLRGQSLGAAIERESFISARACCAALAPIAEALAHAHGQDVVHGDVSPGNIMLPDDAAAQLVDWGSARFLNESAPPARATPACAAPELRAGTPADARSDIYALGRCLQMACAELPKPAALHSLLRHCLAEDPTSRYADAAQLARDLHALALDEPISVHREAAWTRANRWRKRHPRSALTLLLAGISILALVMLLHEQMRLQQRDWRTVLLEDFEDPLDAAAWRQRLYPLWRQEWRQERAPDSDESPWHVRDGALYSRWVRDWLGCVTLQVERPLGADLRASWTVRGLDNGENLNCFIGDERFRAFVIHLGGFGQTELVAVSDFRDGQGLFVAAERLPNPLQADRDYHLQLSLVADELCLRMDGETVLRYRDPFHSGSRRPLRFGLETARNRLRIDDLRIEILDRARHMDSLHSLDLLVEAGAHARALDEYRLLDDDELTARQRSWVRLQMGRCHQALGDAKAAQAIWRHLLHDPATPQDWALAALIALIRARAMQLDELREHVLALQLQPQARLLLFNLLLGMDVKPPGYDQKTADHDTVVAIHAAFIERVNEYERATVLDISNVPLFRFSPNLHGWSRTIGRHLAFPKLREQLTDLHPQLADQAEEIVRNPGERRLLVLTPPPQMPSIQGLVKQEPLSSRSVRVRTLPAPISTFSQWLEHFTPFLRGQPGTSELDAMTASLERIRPVLGASPLQLAICRALLLLGRDQRDAARRTLVELLQDPVAQALPTEQSQLQQLVSGKAPTAARQWWTGDFAQGLIADLAGDPATARHHYSRSETAAHAIGPLLDWRLRRFDDKRTPEETR